MNENLENNAWINEAPVLAAMAKRNPFSVPPGYFDDSEQVVLDQLFLAELKQKTNANVFAVPENYFEELTEFIETRIAFERSEAPMNQFSVPENYFDTLQNRINAKIAQEEPVKQAKIIPLWKRSFVKYASAACFILMASFGVYFYQNSATVNSQNATQLQTADMASELMLYDIDENMIIEHVESQNASKKTTVSASDTEMENYILNNYSSSDLAQEL